MKSARIAPWVPVLALLLMAAGCGSPTPPEEEKGEAETEAAAPIPKSDSATRTEAQPITGKPVVLIETRRGNIKIELYAEKAPQTVENFLEYVDRKFYDRTVFHRVIKNDIIQGGGFRLDMRTFDLSRKWPGDPIENESDNGLKNLRGTVAMARSSDPHSATSQFFINLRDNSRLDRKGDKWGYCVFGKVIEGMDVADKIGRVKTGTKSGHTDVPVRPIIISSIRRLS